MIVSFAHINTMNRFNKALGVKYDVPIWTVRDEDDEFFLLHYVTRVEEDRQSPANLAVRGVIISKETREVVCATFPGERSLNVKEVSLRDGLFSVTDDENCVRHGFTIVPQTEGVQFRVWYHEGKVRVSTFTKIDALKSRVMIGKHYFTDLYAQVVERYHFDPATLFEKEIARNERESRWVYSFVITDPENSVISLRRHDGVTLSYLGRHIARRPVFNNYRGSVKTGHQPSVERFPGIQMVKPIRDETTVKRILDDGYFDPPLAVADQRLRGGETLLAFRTFRGIPESYVLLGVSAQWRRSFFTRNARMARQRLFEMMTYASADVDGDPLVQEDLADVFALVDVRGLSADEIAQRVDEHNVITDIRAADDPIRKEELPSLILANVLMASPPGIRGGVLEAFKEREQILNKIEVVMKNILFGLHPSGRKMTDDEEYRPPQKISKIVKKIKDQVAYHPLPEVIRRVLNGGQITAVAKTFQPHEV